MSSEVPEGWATDVVGSLFSTNTPGHWGEDAADKGNILVLRSTNFRKAGGLNYSTAAARKFDEKKLIQKRLVQGDIILERSGGSPAQPVGRIRRFEAEGTYSASNFMQILRPAPTTDGEFVSFLLHNIYALGWTEALQKATTGIRNLDFKTYLELPIVLPPLDEQRRIAKVLRAVDEAIAAQSGLCALLRQTTDDLADELYAQEIAHSDANLTAYGEACETVQVGIVVKPASHYVDDGGVPALRSTNIKRNAIDFSGLVQLSSAGHELNHKSSLRAGDVVTIRTGEPGKTAVIPDDAPSPLNCIDILFSRPKPPLRPSFASFFINSSTARKQISAMQGGLAQQHFNVGEMKKLHLPVPSLVRQDRVVEVLNAAWLSIRLEEAQLATLRSTKVILMADLLSGRVRVPA